ncbi:MAG: hypothetical protein IRY89_16290 [Pseudolabrys sp.]|nr:hypothetical protein [Pseudolabrys sp.]
MLGSVVLRCAFGAMLAVSVAAGATAQQQGRIRGEIVKAEGSVLALKTREGDTLTVKIDDKTRVSALVKASLADIKNGSFLGIAGMPQQDGSIQAFSVHIFLPEQRGVVPERHGPWDAKPGSTMTNAVVAAMVAARDGTTLTVKYADGEKKVTVAPQTVIAAVTKGDRSELKPGAQVIIFGYDKQPDGSVLARTMYVGRDIAPAM